MEFIAEIIDHHFWSVAAAAAIISVAISIFFEKRRSNRPHLDDVGIMPWTGITVLSTLLSVVAAAFAIKTEWIG